VNQGTRLTKSGAFAHIKTLEQVVADYRKRFDFSSQGGHHDPCLAWTKKASTFPVAIERACSGMTESGKMFSKGSCVRAVSREKLAKALKDRYAALKRATTFEHIYDEVFATEVWGIGPMMFYNVSERIGAWLEIYPEHYVYLHAGPLQGFRRLTGSKGRLSMNRVTRLSLPPVLAALSVHDIEDLLCEYRDLLGPRFLGCTYPNCDCAVAFPEGYKPSEETECPRS
jgi:hypothetical protein